MEATTSTNISLCDLLQRARPLSGSESFKTPSSSSPNPPSKRKRKSQSSSQNPTSTSTNRKPNRSIIVSLNHPALITGTVDLCTDGSDCFWFSDGSFRVCCAVIDFDVEIIGKRIHVVAWNFVPFKSGGGLLEIIRWHFPESVTETNCLRNVDTFPTMSSSSSPREVDRTSRAHIHGRLDSVSPVVSVPCKIQGRNSEAIRNPSNDGKSIGFIAEIAVCECVVGITESSLRQNLHSFTKPVFVYLCGSASYWRPILAKLLDSVVSITGLKKKVVSIGGDESYSMFVTTENAVLYASRPPLDVDPLGRMVFLGRGEVGVYTGIVTGVYMQGMVVELDDKVWVLFTDQLLSLPRCLRVGALISLRNVHLVCPKFSWIKMLLLGACSKTTVDVKSFSPLETQCHFRSQTQSLLGKFIGSLTFSARFWVLLTVSCFRKKFAGKFSDKEILGSKHHEGLAQTYATSCLPSCLFLPRHGMFTEFCKHKWCGCGNEPNVGPLKLVVPLSNFISNCQAMWISVLSQIQNDTEIIGKSDHGFLSCEGKPYGRIIRRIISSEKLGVILMGTLQISPCSGRFELVDATGSIDIVVPDLQSKCHFNNIYEVKDYKLILEGLSGRLGQFGVLNNDAFSCSSIFSSVPPRGELNQLTIYVHFNLRNATCLNTLFRLPSCMDRSDDFGGSKSETFHLLLVTHKFPAIPRFQDDPVISNGATFFAEAIILPYNLLLGENEDAQLVKISKKKQKPLQKCSDKSDYPEKFRCKRPKFAHESLASSSKDNLGDDGKGPDVLWSCRPHRAVSSEQEMSKSGSPFEIPCMLTIRSISDDCSRLPGILLHVVDKPGNRKVLLEFNSESFNKYQLIHIGVYYIMKCASEEPMCNPKDQITNCGKTLATAQTPLWSLSLSSGEVLHQSEPPKGGLFDVSSADELYLENFPQCESLFQKSNKERAETIFDVHMNLPAEAMNFLKEEPEPLEDGSIRSFAKLGQTLTVSTCIQTMIAALEEQFGTADPKRMLPKGNLISLYGNVVDVHTFCCSSVETGRHLNFGNLGDNHKFGSFQEEPSSICIHVYEDHHMVRIQGSVSKHAFPIGLGPGVNATFHRVLMMGSSCRKRELMLTPVSFIVINSIKEVDYHYGDGCFLPPSTPDVLNEDFLDTVSSGLISELIQFMENKSIRIRCRVVGIHILVLEKLKSKFEKARPRSQISIPLAGFVLDDGSSLCCCWADAERAATLLRLHETVDTAFRTCCRSSKKAEINQIQNTTSYHLKKMLKKHNRITVKNYGALLDPSCMDFIITVDPNNILSNLDESLLKFIIFSACCGSVLNVVGSVMDSNAMGRLDRKIMKEMQQFTMRSMQNIWAREVGFLNPLSEARNILQELIR